MDTEDTDIREMLSLQLAEVEMLTSMFPNDGEFVLDDPGAPAELLSFVDGELDYDSVNTRIGFTVKLLINGNEKEKLELVCHFPHEYPTVYPHIFTRSQLLNRDSHRQLNEALNNYMQTLEKGEICTGLLIQWLDENMKTYLSSKSEQKNKSTTVSEKEDKFSRLWIYSHHIYSKFKRTDIINFSKELNLTGFSMPGKPGMICIEGAGRNVEDFWHRIRRMNWKRLVIKEKEDKDITNADKDIPKLRKFPNFEEKCFEPRDGKGRGYHMDLGVLYEFLTEKDCAHIFSLYFGVEGQSAPNE